LLRVAPSLFFFRALRAFKRLMPLAFSFLPLPSDAGNVSRGVARAWVRLASFNGLSKHFSCRSSIGTFFSVPADDWEKFTVLRCLDLRRFPVQAWTRLRLRSAFPNGECSELQWFLLFFGLSFWSPRPRSWGLRAAFCPRILPPS